MTCCDCCKKQEIDNEVENEINIEPITTIELKDEILVIPEQLFNNINQEHQGINTEYKIPADDLLTSFNQELNCIIVAIQTMDNNILMFRLTKDIVKILANQKENTTFYFLRRNIKYAEDCKTCEILLLSLKDKEFIEKYCKEKKIIFPTEMIHNCGKFNSRCCTQFGDKCVGFSVGEVREMGKGVKKNIFSNRAFIKQETFEQIISECQKYCKNESNNKQKIVNLNDIDEQKRIK